MRKFLRKIKRRIFGAPPKKKKTTKPAKPKKERKLSKKNEKRVQKIMKKTGWDHETAYLNMRKAVRTYGIKSPDYVTYAFYRLTEEQQAEKAAKILEKRRKIEEDKEAAILYAMEEMGWTREEAIEKIEATRKRLGISYRRYRAFRMARLEPDGQKREYERRLNRRKEKKQEKADQIKDIMDRTGWTENEVMENFGKARSLIHCGWGEYWQHHIDQMTPEQMSTLFLQTTHGKISRRYPHSPGLRKTLESKEMTNLMFSEFITRPWCINTEITLEEFKEMFKNSTGVICKPVFGLQARDVEAFPFSKMSMDEAYNSILQFPRSIVEELVVQHPDMASLNPTSVNCLRIVSIASGKDPVTVDGKMADISGVSLKIGGGGSIVDNLHAGGGVVCGVDVETGIVITDGVDWEGNVYKTHPATGVVLRGFQVPYFEEAKAFVYEMIDKLGIEGMIGWDMAIGTDGPVLIEPNSRPDPALLSMAFSPEGKGLKDRMMKYLY